jgi:hypothetical protein
LALVPAAFGATITLTASQYGFYYPTGVRTAGNHAVGWYSGADEEIRHYLVFDRSAISGTITGATLRLGNSATSFSTPDGAETWAIFDVNTELAALTGGTGGVGAYNDLGGGTELGSLVVSGSVNNTVSELTLNTAGIAYLNGLSGQFAFGGALTTLTRNPEISERLFNSSSSAGLVRELVVTYEAAAPAAEVPEPGTWLLVAAGLTVLGRTKRPRAAS